MQESVSLGRLSDGRPKGEDGSACTRLTRGGLELTTEGRLLLFGCAHCCLRHARVSKETYLYLYGKRGLLTVEMSKRGL